MFDTSLFEEITEKPRIANPGQLKFIIRGSWQLKRNRGHRGDSPASRARAASLCRRRRICNGHRHKNSPLCGWSGFACSWCGWSGFAIRIFELHSEPLRRKGPVPGAYTAL